MIALLLLGLFIFGVWAQEWELVIELSPFIFFGTICSIIVFRETWKDLSRGQTRRRRKAH